MIWGFYFLQKKKERKLTYLPQAIFPSLVIRFVQTGLVNAKFLCLLPF